MGTRSGEVQAMSLAKPRQRDVYWELARASSRAWRAWAWREWLVGFGLERVERRVRMEEVGGGRFGGSCSAMVAYASMKK